MSGTHKGFMGNDHPWCVKDADAIAKRAEERGSVLRELGLPRGPGKPILIFFNDPDGYEVELYQAP